ncbi:MAG: DUF4091 domain-containing protein [Ignavibacteria bacterium]|nr:DUF4091 domain-containing protein [Ignavibacteria bacterium]
MHYLSRFPLYRAIVMLLAAAVLACSQYVSVLAMPLDTQPTFVFVDPLEKVLPDRSYFPDTPAEMHVCKGEHAGFQFVLLHDKDMSACTVRVEIKDAKGTTAAFQTQTGFVGYVHVGRSVPVRGYDQLFSPSGYYPDPIMELPTRDVPARTPQPIWLTVPIPANTAAGTYTGQITVSGNTDGKPFSRSKSFTMVVHPVTLGAQKLWVTNWSFFGEGQVSLLNGGKKVEPYSKAYWETMRLSARAMKMFRQNVVLVSPLHLMDFSLKNDTYTFDFAKFDTMATIFMDEGAIGRLEGGHIGGRVGTWETPFVVGVPEKKDGKIIFTNKPIDDASAQKFYRQYFPALVAHLKAKKLLSAYMQHLADEPIPSNTTSYIAIAKFVKSIAPELRIIEACHSKDVGETIDVWVPQLNFFHEDSTFYQEQRKKVGKEVWFYTCLAPQGNYANRFIEQPLIKARLLHWINYRFGAVGYLHWGWNAWSENPFGETSGVIPELGNFMPAGDAWIVYPAPGKIWSSIRMEAMRDGIVDYELLTMLTKKFPDRAQEMARQVVYRLDWYDTDIQTFRAKRKELLELLSER